ncbi:MAG: hypothetical protein HETSPECPRED_003612 [Heterodermia speciosa]|uniref:Effector protein n=1 Tax=Heterodermia speciosa TaxID=116794 RepID=A0A8H3F254_9LECA|nr:MAG: hypothetical protein HETSPECPRED_003612 [Heterodermia speciosa]
MHSIPYVIAALLFVASLVVADTIVVADFEPAMIAVITQNHQEQTLIFPHINPQESSAIDQDRYEYVNSILSAVVPESELEEAQNSPGTFALIPLNERPWFEGLPADVKEYLAHMANAEAKMAEFDEASAKFGGEPGPRFRGKGWWWA